jgi:hypothetical protein
MLKTAELIGVPPKFGLEPAGRDALASRFFAQKQWISGGMKGNHPELVFAIHTPYSPSGMEHGEDAVGD